MSAPEVPTSQLYPFFLFWIVLWFWIIRLEKLCRFCLFERDLEGADARGGVVRIRRTRWLDTIDQRGRLLRYPLRPLVIPSLLWFCLHVFSAHIRRVLKIGVLLPLCR